MGWTILFSPYIPKEKQFIANKTKKKKKPKEIPKKEQVIFIQSWNNNNLKNQKENKSQKQNKTEGEKRRKKVN